MEDEVTRLKLIINDMSVYKEMHESMLLKLEKLEYLKHEAKKLDALYIANPVFAIEMLSKNQPAFMLPYK